MTTNSWTPIENNNAPLVKPIGLTRRAGAWLFDGLFLWLLLLAIFGTGVAFLLTTAWVGFNGVWMRGKTGRSLGEVLMGTRVCRLYESDFNSDWYLIKTTPVLMLTRTVARVLDFIPLFYGVIRPARHRLGQTFSDQVTSTIVIKDHPQHVLRDRDEVLKLEQRR